MKKLLILLLLSLSFNSYGEYTKVNENVEDDSYYIDFQTLRPVDDDYVVWWEMRDLAKSRDGYMSSQIYYKGDCVQTRTKLLSIIQYTGSMGTGQSEDISGGFVNLEDIMGWTYPPPSSVTYDNLGTACYLAQEYSKSDYERTLQELIDRYESFSWVENTLSSFELVDASLTEQQQILQSAWVSNISTKIKSVWLYQGAKDDWWCNVYISQKRNGEVKAVTFGRCFNFANSSKEQSFKNSLEKAVYKSSPLPYAPDDSVFDEEIMFTFFVN